MSRENNTKAKVKSSSNARVQASVLSMYDSLRLKGPMREGKEISWEELNKNIIEELESMKANNSPVALLTQTFASPSTSKIIKDFKSIGYKVFSTRLLLNAMIPKLKPKIKESGAATNIKESVCMEGFH